MYLKYQNSPFRDPKRLSFLKYYTHKLIFWTHRLLLCAKIKIKDKKICFSSPVSLMIKYM